LYGKGLFKFRCTNNQSLFLVEQFTRAATAEMPNDSDLDDATNLRMDILVMKNLRYELLDMPENGWEVNVVDGTCGCIINFKDGCCVHVLVAKMNQRIEFNGWKPPLLVLVNRRHQRRGTRIVNAASRGANVAMRGPGRPRQIGNAYNIE
jgi:hypothetical protein